MNLRKGLRFGELTKTANSHVSLGAIGLSEAFDGLYHASNDRCRVGRFRDEAGWQDGVRRFLSVLRICCGCSGPGLVFVTRRSVILTSPTGAVRRAMIRRKIRQPTAIPVNLRRIIHLIAKEELAEPR